MFTTKTQMALKLGQNEIPRAFFAYPSRPYSRSETLSEAARKINKYHVAQARTWEELSVSGKSVIQEICKEISQSQIFCADITGLNPNVMFELGFAIARDKRIWLVSDTTFPELRKQFDQLGLLTTTGYAPYTNSDDIVHSFLRDRPYEELDETVFRQSIQPTLTQEEGDIIVYLKNVHDTNASIRISKSLGDSDIPLIIDDPKEAGVQTLSWYGQKVFSSMAVVTHLLNPEREGAQSTNAKYAFVSGMAFGFDRPLLMLAEPEYVSPIDYRDLLLNYKTATQAVDCLQQWLSPIEKRYREKIVSRDDYSGTLRLKVELRDFYVQIGEYLAENEINTLESYYIETTAYREALAGMRTIFIGRKGSGKTANLMALATELRKEKNNVVCLLQPVGYEIESLVRLFNLYRERDTKGYVIESLWKFLLLTELANATAKHVENRPLWIERDNHEKELLELLELEDQSLKGDFSVRLERCVSTLLSVQQSTSVEQQRKGISEALHETKVKKLRAVLGDVLSEKSRVAILIDDLDKAWVKQADISQLSEFLLGLFSAGKQLLLDFSRSDSRRKAVNCTAAIFLRSDIFNKVQEVAREPDKLVVTRLVWDDPDILSRVVEMRFSRAHPEETDGKELWSRYFAPLIKGMSARDYVLSRVLPRPRDMIYLIKAAISTAVNRGRALIHEDDVLSAEQEYSRYALSSILVENSITLPQLQDVLYEFLRYPVVVTEQQIRALLAKVRIPLEKQMAVIDHLVGLSFLGLEVSWNHFVFSDEPRDLKKHLVLANKLAEQHAVRRYRIHPAFCSYLEIIEV